jgi:hypothetical protein
VVAHRKLEEVIPRRIAFGPDDEAVLERVFLLRDENEVPARIFREFFVKMLEDLIKEAWC